MEKIVAFFASLSLLFNFAFGGQSPTVGEGYSVTKVDKLTGISALYAGQGMDTDGAYYYTSGSLFVKKTGFGLQYLAKWSKDFKKEKVNLHPIPASYSKTYGCGHIGGISESQGIIYAPVEGTDYSVNFVFLYDAKTLEMIKAYNVSNAYLDDGIPWIAVDNENGFAYCTRWGDTNKLLRFRLEDMTLDGVVELDKTLCRIQGGDFYDGTLYLSKDIAHQTTETVYAVNVQTGEVTEIFFTSFAGNDNEAEDMAVYPDADGSLFHILNYDKMLNIRVVHIAPTAR